MASPRTIRSVLCANDLIAVACELLRETVLDCELEPVVAGVEAIAEVVAVRPLELAARHYVRHRRSEEIDGRVLTGLECCRCLEIAIVDVDTRIPDRAREMRVPLVIEVRAQPEV